MKDAIVIGAGPSGLTVGLLLAKQGLDVVVLERSPDPAPETPEAAWASWDRQPVAQFRQAHILLPRGRLTLDAHLPEVVDRLVAGGGLRWSMIASRPPSIADWVDDPSDERFDTVAARRPMIDWAFSQVADAMGLEIHRGATVRSLLVDDGEPVPRVAGVATEAGEVIRSKVVVDASGRRTPVPQMLIDVGLSGPREQREDSGFAYYTRFFQAADGSTPQPLAGLLSPIGSISLLTLPGDNGSWSVTIYGSSADSYLRALRDPTVFDRVVSSCPLHIHWLEGEPISAVGSMTSVVDRIYDYRPAGQPLVRGLLAVGDAWACTNPSLGRGISMGIGHAVEAATAIAEHLDEPAQLVETFWQATADNHAPWHEATLAQDRLRVADIETFRTGGTAVTDPENPVRVLSSAFPVAATQSAEVFRAFAEMVCALSLPRELLARPGLADRIIDTAGGVDPPQAPGPNRGELVELLS